VDNNAAGWRSDNVGHHNATTASHGYNGSENGNIVLCSNGSEKMAMWFAGKKLVMAGDTRVNGGAVSKRCSSKPANVDIEIMAAFPQCQRNWPIAVAKDI